MRALSVRQPYAYQILRGTKKIEYRSKVCRIIGERFYIYASAAPPDDADDHAAIVANPVKYPTGLLIGTAEITKCRGCDGSYRWCLSKPRDQKAASAAKAPSASVVPPILTGLSLEDYSS